jgi:hypothetical protein
MSSYTLSISQKIKSYSLSAGIGGNGLHGWSKKISWKFRWLLFRITPRYQFSLLDQRISLDLSSGCSRRPGDRGGFAGLLIARLFRRSNQVRKFRFRAMRRDPLALMP